MRIRIYTLPGYDWVNKYYIVDANGNVWGKYGRLLKNSYDCYGYCRVDLYGNQQHKTVFVHKLVFLAFGGSIANGLQIDHRNGIKDDNRISNLRIVTPHENTHNPNTFKHHSGKIRSRKVRTCNVHTNEIIEHNSVCNCAKYFGVHNAQISEALKKGYKVRDCEVSYVD